MDLQSCLAGRVLRACTFFALAAFFGNTAAIYMNCYFGTVSQPCFSAAFFVDKQRYLYAGLFFSWALLSDTEWLFALPFFLFGHALA